MNSSLLARGETDISLFLFFFLLGVGGEGWGLMRVVRECGKVIYVVISHATRYSKYVHSKIREG